MALSSYKLLIGAVVLPVLIGTGGWLAVADGREPLRRNPSAMNPHGYPPIEACTTVLLADPVAEAKTNIAKGDLRPFTIDGIARSDVPGVFCPSGNYRMDSRGGAVVSDIPDACGKRRFSSAALELMEAYNRTLAEDRGFQKITGCRPSTYCEERYRKGSNDAKQRDPRCPGEPAVLLRIARIGSTSDLAEALKDFSDGSPRSRDAKTSAFIAALRGARWQNADELIRAGADVDGRALEPQPRGGMWFQSPLATVFGQTQDREAQLDRARWLFANGMTFANPHASDALTGAVSNGDLPAVDFLLAKGASPNGRLSRADQDRLVTMDLSGTAHVRIPFAQALNEATKNWVRRTSDEIAFADEAQRKGRINAVKLYRAGGRFFAGMPYDSLRQRPDIKVASILLAAAHREGRLQELITRILFPNGPTQELNPGSTDEERALVRYLQEVAACRTIAPAPKLDFVKICSEGAI